MQSNQYVKGSKRPLRLPIVPVSGLEKNLVNQAIEQQRITYAQLQRAGLVALGVLPLDSLHDLPRRYREEIAAMVLGRR